MRHWWLLLLVSCQAGSNLSSRNVAYLYGTNAEALPEMLVLNQSDTTVVVHCTVPSTWPAPAEADNLFSLSVRYRVFFNYGEVQAFDSALVVVKTLAPNAAGFLEIDVPVKLPRNRNTVIDLRVQDLSSPKRHQCALEVISPARFGKQWLQVSASNSSAAFHLAADSHRVTSTQTVSTLYSRYFKASFEPASPPFSAETSRSPQPKGSINEVLELRGAGYFNWPTAAQGVYQLRADSSSADAATYAKFAPGFPKAVSVTDLLYPIRYIATNPEFDALVSAESMKKSVDGFWLELGGSEARARQLIAAYYGRVEQANRLFTTYREGWKTDRGMCLIVFGAPTGVFKTTTGETWFYGPNANVRSLQLDFVKAASLFSTNEYRLQRSAAHRTPWYRAVDAWRQGRVVNYR